MSIFQGPRGRRGPKGDNGEVLALGPQGIPEHAIAKGEQGDQGEQGEHGEQGRRGARGRSAFRQFAVLGVFILLTALALAYMVQGQRQYVLEQCELRRTAVIHNNWTWQELTKIEEIPIPTTSAASKARIEQRIKVYADAQVTVPNCEVKP